MSRDCKCHTQWWEAGVGETAEGIQWVEAEGGTHPTEHTAALTAHSQHLQNLNIPEVERSRLP